MTPLIARGIFNRISLLLYLFGRAGRLRKVGVRSQELKEAVTELSVNGGQEQWFLNILLKEGRQVLHYTILKQVCDSNVKCKA